MSSQTDDIYAETVAVFDQRDGREPLTTPEVAAALDANRRAVYERLRTLADRGALETKAVGSNARVWWRPVGASESNDGVVGTPNGVERADQAEPGERERALERRSRVMESAIDGIAITDEDGEYFYVNQTHADVYGYDDATAFLGENWRVCYDEAETDRFESEIIPQLYDEGAWHGEARGQRRDGTTFPQELSMTVSDQGGIICVVRDVTDRKERERRLREARRFNEELVENAPFGMFRLDEDLRITYENPRAEEIIGLPEHQEQSAAVGTDIRKLPPIIETGQADLFTSLQDGDTIEFDFPFESIYDKEAYFTGRAVPVYRDGAFDGAILMATDISERRQYERELERQREQLAALDELNDVVRRITEAVIEQSTRTEIEREVCERLAASDSYRCAWIGGVDSDSGLETRVEAGTDGLFGDRSFETAAESADETPIERVVETREIQVIQNLHDGSSPPEDYESVAVIPVVHQGRFYDVLGVCSARPDAFAEKERAVVGQLGDVIGHAITAVARKRALMSDEVVELDICISNVDDVTQSAEGTATIDRVTPIGDGEYLLYGTATAGALETLRAMGDQRPEWGRVQTFDEREGERRFEQHLFDPPITSIVADFGGNFQTGTIETGEYTATVQFPPGTNVRVKSP